MDFMTALDLSGAGLTAQRTKMNVISANLANISTTRTAEGVPYRRKVAMLEAAPIERDFGSFFDSAMEELDTVRVQRIQEDSSPFRTVYSPGHPDADAQGYVSFPNVNAVEEMADLTTASRTYEANVAAIAAVKRMANKALEIGR